MAARLVGAAAEQGDSSLGGAASYLRDRRLRLGPLETGEIAGDVLLPRDGLVEVRAQQLGHRAQLLEPHAHALLADAARPEPHDQHARAVVRGRGLVDAPGGDVGRRPAHRSSWGAPIWPPTPPLPPTPPRAPVARLGLYPRCLTAWVAAAAAPPEGGHGGLSREQHRLEVHRHHTVPLVLGRIHQRLARLDADVVVQHVEPAPAADGLGHHRLAVRLVGDVGGEGERLALLRADEPDRLLRAILLRLHAEHARALARHEDRGGLAVAHARTARARARHDRDLAGESFAHWGRVLLGPYNALGTPRPALVRSRPLRLRDTAPS